MQIVAIAAYDSRNILAYNAMAGNHAYALCYHYYQYVYIGTKLDLRSVNYELLRVFIYYGNAYTHTHTHTQTHTLQSHSYNT